MDINSPHSVERYVKEVGQAELVERDCVEHLYCGLPYLVPVVSMIWKTHWIPGPMPYLATPLKMTVLERTKTAIGETISFKAEGTMKLPIFFYFALIYYIPHPGPSHLGIMFSPVKGVELQKWSLSSEPLVTNAPWNNRDTYFIFYSYAANMVPFNLTLELRVNMCT